VAAGPSPPGVGAAAATVTQVLLLHGFTLTGASWRPVIEALGSGFDVIAPDIRGHGIASECVPVTLDVVVRDIAELVRGQFTLVGYSMGGRIALHVAVAMPERITRLVLVGASPGIASEEERAARRAGDERLAEEFEGLAIEELAERWASTPVLEGQPSWIHADRLRNTPAGLARALRGLGTGALPSLWERLGELTMPVVLVVGERDQKFRAVAGEMAAAIAECEVVAVPSAGHAVHLEAPQAVAQVIAGR
jgi:2-succinyl-6-hydroxy-2,4-cyclohexadiene-1-carboxylate synthase